MTQEIEKRLSEIETFQKHWKFYFWAVVVIALLFSIFFSYKVSDINKLIDEMQTNVDELEKRIKKVDLIAMDAESTIKKAQMQAGDLQFAVSESKKAADVAKEASKVAALASHQSAEALSEVQESLSIAITTESAVLKIKDEIGKTIVSVSKAEKAAQRAEAISSTMQSRLRQAEELLSEIKEQTIQKTKSNIGKQRILEIKLSAGSLKLYFIEGSYPYNIVEIKDSFYEGRIYVPENAIVRVVGKSTFSEFYVPEKFRERVIDLIRESSNKWIYK